MGKTVILSVQDGQWDKWGRQFVARQPLARQQNLISTHPTVAQAKAAILDAAAAAGAGGTLIISVGHGGGSTDNLIEGMIDLAPGRVMRIAGANADYSACFISAFYDVNLAGPPYMSDMDNDLKNNPQSQRLVNWRVYKEIADRVARTGLYRVVFLTCNVGNSTEFVRKIANDWKVVCLAYRKRVAGLFSADPKRRAIVSLENHMPVNPDNLKAADVILAEEELPYFPSEIIQIGPPLHG